MWSKYPEIHEELKLIEAFVLKSIRSKNRLLTEVSTELVEAGGKRLRPAFVVICSKFGKYDRDKVLATAGALEILHTATLVHDDIVDCSKLRRGRVTVSEKYGVDMAVYTGDFLYTKAVLMLANAVPADKLEMIAKGIKEICEGEVDQYRDKFKADTSVLSYLKRIGRKTAALFSSACGLGAGISRCSDKLSKKLARFGFYYGMAFQIRDDINDFISDADRSGKPVGKDLAEGVVTLPAIYASRKSSRVRHLLADLMEKKGRATTEEIAGVIALIKKHNGIADAENMLGKYIDRGLKQLEGLPDNEYRDMLKKLLEGLAV